MVIGGPVSTATFNQEHLKQLLYGMEGIVGNAFGFDSIPTHDQILAGVQALAMDDLLTQGHQLPDPGHQRRRRRPRSRR